MCYVYHHVVRLMADRAGINSIRDPHTLQLYDPATLRARLGLELLALALLRDDYLYESKRHPPVLTLAVLAEHLRLYTKHLRADVEFMQAVIRRQEDAPTWDAAHSAALTTLQVWAFPDIDTVPDSIVVMEMTVFGRLLPRLDMPVIGCELCDKLATGRARVLRQLSSHGNVHPEVAIYQFKF
jgi:hypothetical protein